eukprot:747833-Hanusia_phi.AAC.1
MWRRRSREEEERCGGGEAGRKEEEGARWGEGGRERRSTLGGGGKGEDLSSRGVGYRAFGVHMLRQGYTAAQAGIERRERMAWTTWTNFVCRRFLR